MKTAMKFEAAVAAVLFGSIVAAAQAPWPQQPSEVMGIRLGAPLESAGILPCDASNEVRGQLSTQSFCYQSRAAASKPDRRFLTVNNSPDFGAGTQEVVIDTAYGQVAGILLTGDAVRFDKMVAVLEARYGPATETVAGKAHDRSGREYATVSKRWRGDKVTIEATSPSGETDEFTVYWSDLGMQARRDSQSARETRSNASKL
jgi:hypothetical protein